MPVIFLKLGGSLITDKTRPYTAHKQKIRELALEIAAALKVEHDLSLLLGHGSGSFGHVAARLYHTEAGVKTQKEWRGFAEVGYQAARLNHLVMDALHDAGVPAMNFSPSANAIASHGDILHWDIQPIQSALANGILPVVHGDVAFDETLGGTILSTESLFAYLAQALTSSRILLAGSEAGVWADYPARHHLLADIQPGDKSTLIQGLNGSAGIDVTGGMQSKVEGMLDLIARIPGLEVVIFSGKLRGSIGQALQGHITGTRLHR